MDTIKVKGRKESDGVPYQTWERTAKKQIGIPDEDILLWGFPDDDYEFTWIDGSLYYRLIEETAEFFTLDTNHVKGGADPPHVICSCGCIEFTLRYGRYKILARCVACNHEETVYSG